MKVFNDLKTRGVADILIAVTAGLKGMGEALGLVYPDTTLQTCIVHLIRNSLDYANWKERKALAAAIKPIYKAASAEAAQVELDAFEEGPLLTYGANLCSGIRSSSGNSPTSAQNTASGFMPSNMRASSLPVGLVPDSSVMASMQPNDRAQGRNAGRRSVP